METLDTMVPICAMLRRSLSSEAAASLATALTCAAPATSSFFSCENQTDACGAPPRASASSRMARAEGMATPAAALARVLARLILARSSASAGSVPSAVVVTSRASSPAMVFMRPSRQKTL
jgi:hypothetical protein